MFAFGDRSATPTDANGTPRPPYSTQPSDDPGLALDALLALPGDQIAGIDVARMNLECAAGLPGAEDLDIGEALRTLDEWTSRVRAETERHLYRVSDPRYAEHYRHSEAYFRAEMLLQVLQVDLGVKYNAGAAWDFSFKDSRVAFLHGMIPPPGRAAGEMRGGTCLSMPVMYVAVGRRLGYPLRLVLTDSHVFVRWDGASDPNPAWRERFNIEGAGEGFSSFPDDHYRRWPKTVSPADVRSNRYLASLTPPEEFALFLAARGHCEFDNGDAVAAARSYEYAWRFDPTRPCYVSWFMDAAVLSGYSPTAPELAELLAQRD